MTVLIFFLFWKEFYDMVTIITFTELLLCAKFWQPLLNYLSLTTACVAFQRWLSSQGLLSRARNPDSGDQLNWRWRAAKWCPKISKPLTATERGRSLTDGWKSADTSLVGQGETSEYTQTTEIRDLQSTSSFQGLSQITALKDVQSTHLKGHNKGRHEQRDRTPNMSDWLKWIEKNKTHPPAPLQALTFWT